jgi:hypothetical protein
MGGRNLKRPTAMTSTMNHATSSFSKEIFAGAMISVVQYLAPLRSTVGAITGSDHTQGILRSNTAFLILLLMGSSWT